MVLSIILIWRTLLFLAAVVFRTTLSFTPRFPYSDIYLIPSKLPLWVWSWANFDGVHYLTIAKLGYAAQYTQAFFPLYPLLIRLTAFILRDSSYIISGLLISFFSFYFGVKRFMKLLRLDYAPHEVRRTICFLLLFPTSFYFAALYTESIFFFLMISSLLAAREKKWIQSAVYAMFASSTRITGIFLLPVLLIEWVKVRGKIPVKSASTVRRFFQLFKQITISPFLYIVPLGLILYMSYLQVKFGDALYFLHAQAAFGAERSASIILLPQVLWRYIKILTSPGVNIDAFFIAANELVFFLFVSMLLFISHKLKIRRSYILFAWLVLLTPTITGTLSSIPRYVLLAFPIYIVLGKIKNLYLRNAMYVSFICFMVILSARFVTGLWVG